MKRIEFPVSLIGPTGDHERWIFRSMPLKGLYGQAHWVDRELRMNHRLRSQPEILYTLAHELSHVTGGQNISEAYCENFEANLKTVCTKLGLTVHFENL